MRHLLAIIGILTRASEAKDKTEEAQEKESLELAVTSSQMEDVNTLEITEEKLSDAIKQQFGNNKDFSITDNGDGSFLVSMNDTQRMYYIDENGEVIDQSKMLKISTADELKSFRDDVNSGNTYEGWYIYMANDIILDNTPWTPIGIYLGLENEDTTTFNGIFDGCGYEIDGMLIDNNSDYQGFFGYVYEGTIKNIGIGKNSTVKCSKSSGSLIASMRKSKIINCYNKASIDGTTSVGGVIGVVNINSEIINCYNSGSVSGTINVGGVVGNSMDSKIMNCYNTGAVTAIKPGGISGQSVQGSTINNCYNIGNITKLEGNTYIDYSHYAIVAGIDEKTEINNCYYLNGSVNGGNDIDECEGVINNSSEELKLLATVLGDAFEEDLNNINNGYPILTWQ